ncbi:MAG: hypothetical protein PF483_11335 [Halothiobacillus sp.]|jgi:hypothetical protein|uniref:hypothetical protein n=1 Tax=Halothiobacillus sp. TaxID=1891311 RepID=UPI002AD4CB4D|nr:hypothetical protein [Halothiobacillus sp.]MDA3877667.1 hypothetical protein [Halothiobacillus sp.]
MKRRSFLMTIVAFFGYVFGRTGTAATQSQGMMAGGMCSMMSKENMQGPMRTGMELFQRHELIHRQVTELPNGVHVVTTSNDPATASIIKKHVVEMYARLDKNQPFPYPVSKSVPKMFANPTGYQRKLEVLPNGIAITETSADHEMVAVIRAHAQELNGFVKEGMPAMMREMMQNGNGM